MEKENGGNKAPNWQWIASGAISLLLFFSSIMLLAALSDIKEGKVVAAKLDLRVTTIEQTIPLQFEAIREWREEIKQSLAQIARNQNYNANRSTGNQESIIKEQKSAAKTKGIVIFGK